MTTYVKAKKAREILGVCDETLRNWDKQGKIEIIRGGGKQRLYNVQKFLKPEGSIFEPEEIKKTKYIYCRVSSAKQKKDLDRQACYLKEKYPENTVLTEIASGINFKRKVLNRILEEAYRGTVEEIVVAHKDRLCRISWDHFEWLFNLYGVKVIVDDNDPSHTPESELAEDLLSIVHVFSCRHYGQRRKYGKRKISGGEKINSSETKEFSSCESNKEWSET